MKTVYQNRMPLEGQNKYLKIELYYSLGGMNYFTSRVEPRGYYISAEPIERTELEGGCTMESYTAFSGLKKCILECKRQSNAREAQALELMEEFIDDLIEAVLQKNGLKLGGAA